MSLPRADDWTDPGEFRPPRSRRGLRLTIATVLLVPIAVGAVLVARLTSLSGLPLIPPPVAPEAGTIAIPDDENAFTYYKAAVDRLVGQPQGSGKSIDWGLIAKADQDWFFANADATAIWFEGTTKDRAVYLQPSEIGIDEHFDVAQRLRTFTQLAHLAALRMISVGEPGEAWDWYRATLRCSRHLGQHGSFIERIIGYATYNTAAKQIRTWADAPNLSPSLLRRAFDDVLAVNASTVPIAGPIRVEYFTFARLFDAPELDLRQVLTLMESARAGPEPTPLGRFKERLTRFVLREPERSRRVFRLVWANWLSVGDLPEPDRIARRRPFAHGLLYDPPPNAPAEARLLTPEALNGWAESTYYFRRIVPAIEALEKVIDLDRAARAGLVVTLAERLFALERGKPPASVDDLIGPYLTEIPDGYVRPEEARP